jgi:hypothetical protein
VPLVLSTGSQDWSPRRVHECCTVLNCGRDQQQMRSETSGCEEIFDGLCIELHWCFAPDGKRELFSFSNLFFYTPLFVLRKCNRNGYHLLHCPYTSSGLVDSEVTLMLMLMLVPSPSPFSFVVFYTLIWPSFWRLLGLVASYWLVIKLQIN